MSLRCSGTTPRRSPRRHVCRSVPLDATWQAGTHVHDTATFAATLHVRPGLPTSRRLACSGLGLPFVPCVADRRRRRVAPCRFARCVFLIHKGPPRGTRQDPPSFPMDAKAGCPRIQSVATTNTKVGSNTTCFTTPIIGNEERKRCAWPASVLAKREVGRWMDATCAWNECTPWMWKVERQGESTVEERLCQQGTSSQLLFGRKKKREEHDMEECSMCAPDL